MAYINSNDHDGRYIDPHKPDESIQLTRRAARREYLERLQRARMGDPDAQFDQALFRSPEVEIPEGFTRLPSLMDPSAKTRLLVRERDGEIEIFRSGGVPMAYRDIEQD